MQPTPAEFADELRNVLSRIPSFREAQKEGRDVYFKLPGQPGTYLYREYDQQVRPRSLDYPDKGEIFDFEEAEFAEREAGSRSRIVRGPAYIGSLIRQTTIAVAHGQMVERRIVIEGGESGEEEVTERKPLGIKNVTGGVTIRLYGREEANRIIGTGERRNNPVGDSQKLLNELRSAIPQTA